MSSNKSLAAGIVVYNRTKENNILYLLLKASYPPYHWTPPKGHVDKGETESLVTALRETEEEAGLSQSDLELKKFETTITYEVKGKPKFVTYYLAKLKKDKEVVLSDEHTDFRWVDCVKACELIGFPSTGKVISQCQEFIEANDK